MCSRRWVTFVNELLAVDVEAGNSAQISPNIGGILGLQVDGSAACLVQALRAIGSKGSKWIFGDAVQFLCFLISSDFIALL